MNRSITSASILVLGSLVATAAAQESSAAGTLLAPKAFRAAAAKVESSIVRIEGFGGIAPGGGAYQQPGQRPTTGVIISPDGYIITSTFNFLSKPPVVTVVLADGERKIARVLGRDETRKICLLKIDGVSALPVPQSAPRKELKVGQWAVAIGVGFGAKQPAISAGIISATSRISGKAVQTDANTSPANYGGPLVDLDGRVIGICVPLTAGAQTAAAGAEWYDSGIGFAVPLDGLESVLDRLKSGETLQHAFLGVQCESVGEEPTGARVEAVVLNSAAAKAGLVDGDRIHALGETEILDVAHLATVIHGFLAGDKIEITVLRGTEKLTKTVELTSLASAPTIVAPEKSPPGKKAKPGPPNRPKPQHPPL